MIANSTTTIVTSISLEGKERAVLAGAITAYLDGPRDEGGKDFEGRNGRDLLKSIVKELEGVKRKAPQRRAVSSNSGVRSKSAEAAAAVQ